MRRRAHLVAAAVVALLASCGVDAGDGAAPATTEPGTATTAGTGASTTTTLTATPDAGDPSACEDAAAVGEALGAEVDGFPTDGTMPAGDTEYSWSGCSYTSFDDDDLGFLDVERLRATRPADRRLYEVLDAQARAAVWNDQFEPVDGLGEGAYLDGTTVVVKAGDVLVFADYEPEDLGRLTAPTPAIDLARAALDLALSVDAPPTCDEVDPIIEDVIGEVDDSRTSSGFIGVNDVSLTTAGCAADLAAGGEATIAVSDAASWDAWIAAKESFDLRSSYEALEVAGRPAFDDGRRLVVDDLVADPEHSPWMIDTGLWDGDPDEGRARRIAVAEAVIDG